jgi:hypothetical protein
MSKYRVFLALAREGVLALAKTRDCITDSIQTKKIAMVAEKVSV